MNKPRNKILSFALATALLIGAVVTGILPATTVYAATGDEIIMGLSGDVVVSEAAFDTTIDRLASNGWLWNGTTHTLTINSTYTSGAIGFWGSTPVTLHVADDVAITINHPAYQPLSSTQSLTITGRGNLTLENESIVDRAKAIAVMNDSDLTINMLEDGTVTAKAIWPLSINPNNTVTVISGSLSFNDNPAPTLTDISPNAGHVSGGTTVTLSGTGFTGAWVTVGGTAADISAHSDTSITFTTPPGAAGTANVSVVSDNGAVTMLNGFTYKTDQQAPVITINTQPAPETTVTEGAISGSLTVGASATQGATLGYQWYTCEENGGNPAGISGATSASFAIPTSLTSGTYYYICKVTANGINPVTSNMAKVIVEPEEPPITGTATPTVVSADLIELDLNGVNTAYIQVSLGSSSVPGDVLAGRAVVTVNGGAATATPADLAADGNIKVEGLAEGIATIDIAFSGEDVADNRYDKTITVSVTNSSTPPQQHTITASVTTAGGSISPSGSVIVNKGDDQTFTITPDAGYYIQDVLIDGISVGVPSSYTFYNVGDDHRIAAAFLPNSANRDNDSNTSGSSGTGSTRTSAPANTPADVTTASATTAAATAAKAAKESGASTATVRIQNPGNITLAAMQAMASAAGMPVRFQADSMSADGKAVEVRITLDPAKAAKALNLTASTQNARAKASEAFFEKHFKNNVGVISLGQQGGFGQPVEIAAKLDPTGMDTKNLYFYSYDKATNSYQRIEKPAYWIDANGYLHFTTELAGDIIVSDGPLTPKGQN